MIEFTIEVRRTSDNSVADRRTVQGAVVPRVGDAVDSWEFGFTRVIAVIHDLKTRGSSTVQEIIVVAGYAND